MPYIEQKYRDQINKEVDALALAINKVFHEEKEKAKLEGKERFQTRDGLANYAFTRILRQLYPESNYHEMNEQIGLLECCKQELYKEDVAPYEDLKKNSNGAVPTYTKEEILAQVKADKNN